MNAMKNKIKSQRGASITFALLIFLVCAIISGVVIVAGSTAAGRMSQIAQSDQRYYAVTSAAGLLRDEIDGTRVTVSYKRNDYGSITPSVTKVTTKSAPSTDIKGTKTLIEDATCWFVRNLARDSTLSSVTDPGYTLTVSTAEDVGNVDLSCSITEKAMTDGRLIFEITNPIPASGTTKPSYTLQIVFNANISESSSQGKDTSGNDITVVTADIEWSFAGVKKGALPTTT